MRPLAETATMPDPAAGRKPPKRFWLFAPYALAMLCALAWSLVWLVIRGQVAARLDAASAGAARSGYVLSWSAKHIGGYPFSIKITVDNLRMGEASGWGLAARRVEAVANAYDLNHWVIAAPDGLAFERPRAGPVQVTGHVVRASWVGLGQGRSRIAFEGVGLAFSPGAGAKPFLFTNVGRLGVFTRPTAGGDVEARVFLYDAEADPEAWPGWGMSDDERIGMVWQGVIGKPAAFEGPNALAAARAWSVAGGAVTTELGGAATGTKLVGVRSSCLCTDAAGRLIGRARLLTGDVVSRAPDGAAKVDGWREFDLTILEDGLRIGPAQAGRAPKLF